MTLESEIWGGGDTWSGLLLLLFHYLKRSKHFLIGNNETLLKAPEFILDLGTERKLLLLPDYAVHMCSFSLLLLLFDDTVERGDATSVWPVLYI